MAEFRQNYRPGILPAGLANRRFNAAIAFPNFSQFPSYEGSSVKHQNRFLFPAASELPLLAAGLPANLVSGGMIRSQTTFPYSGEEFFSGGATL